MIIEVDDKIGLCKSFKSLDSFCYEHREELDKRYKEKFSPKIEVEVWNQEHLERLLPTTSPIKKIASHNGYIVVVCENGERYSLDRLGDYPFFALHDHGWR